MNWRRFWGLCERIEIGGMSVIVDKGFPRDRYKLSPTGNGYIHVVDKVTKERTHLHRLILGLKNGDGQIADHINRNRLDNRRANLRVVPVSISVLNRSNKNEYRGVWERHWNTKVGTRIAYCAVIKKDYKAIHLGTYKTKRTAARAYDEKAKELWGEYAVLNFPLRNQISV